MFFCPNGVWGSLMLPSIQWAIEKLLLWSCCPSAEVITWFPPSTSDPASLSFTIRQERVATKEAEARPGWLRQCLCPGYSLTDKAGSAHLHPGALHLSSEWGAQLIGLIVVCVFTPHLHFFSLEKWRSMWLSDLALNTLNQYSVPVLFLNRIFSQEAIWKTTQDWKTVQKH